MLIIVINEIYTKSKKSSTKCYDPKKKTMNGKEQGVWILDAGMYKE